MKRAPTADILWLFICSRIALLLVTYFAYTLLNGPRPPQYIAPPVSLLAAAMSWKRWDAVHYVEIAQFGYRSPFDSAFFPLFPLLITILAHLVGNHGYLFFGMLISNLALLGSLFTLYQLASEALGDQVSRRTLLYLCIFPTAFFFFAAYNESLFLLLVTGCFLAMRRRRWWLAGLLGMLASLTRSPGILLVLPFLWEAWAARNSLGLLPERSEWRSFILRILPVVLIPLGTAIYCLYCWHLFHSPFSFAAVQYRWSHRTVWPWVGIWKALVELFWLQPAGSLFSVHLVLDLSATLGFIVLAVLGWRRLRFSYTLWMAALLLLYLVEPSINQPDSLISNQRFVLEMFPGFMTLAALACEHPRLHQAITLIFPPLLATLTIIFIQGFWMV
ncbi:mannosyltransferase family protein [Thermogemmatispora onikobensis]|uniref:mannosyltransferase family protein n=1 Tax=Thermogemmatispora onikobensis TaxID=732234 RepID=UPI000853C4A0|nr:mannosyltransferase family protein [Thermogemmatispora onikobensis]